MKPIIGSVPYLNARPLTRWFESEEGKVYAEVWYATPSVLAQWLKTGKVAVALVSSTEAFRRSDTPIVPGIAIASEREVLSVRLFSKVPFEQVRSVALDTSSLTSSALVQVILNELYGLQPLYEPMPPDLPCMLAQCDAGLLIGDKGMMADAKDLHVMDLGEVWYGWTGLPFVWAVWLANEGSCSEELMIALHRAKEWGLSHLDAIIAEESARLGIPASLCARYLQEIMVYDLTPRYEQGLQLFISKCRALGLI